MARNNAPSLVAGGNISTCRFVKASTAADYQCLQAGANDLVIGICGEGSELAPIPSQSTQYHASSGRPGELFVNGEPVLLLIGAGGVTRGDRIKSDADGKGVTIASTGTTVQHVGAVALESAAADEKAHVLVRIEDFRPALA